MGKPLRLSPEDVATEQIMAVIESAFLHQTDAMGDQFRPVGRVLADKTVFEIRQRMPEILTFLNLGRVK